MKRTIAILLSLLLACPSWAIEKNVSSQFLELQAIDSSTGAPKTGDSANITAYQSIDGGTLTALGDTGASEVSSTNAPGVYRWDLTAAETNGINIAYSGKSSTSNVYLIPRFVATVPPNFGKLSVDSNGRLDLIKIAGTSQTARDIGASVLLSNGEGTGQLKLFNGRVVAANGPVGKTYYIDDDDGSGDLGTKESPYDSWSQLTGAVTLAPGDTVHYAAGTYTNGNTTITISTPRLVIEGEGEDTVIQPDLAASSDKVFDVAARCVTFRDMKITTVDGGVPISAVTFTNTTDYFRGERLQLDGTFDGINLTGAQFPSLVDCDITATFDGGNASYTRGMRLINCRFFTDGSDSGGTVCAGLVCEGAVNAEMTNCRFRAARAVAASTQVAGLTFGTDSLHTESVHATLNNCIVEAVASHASNTGKVVGIGEVSSGASAWSVAINGGRISTTNAGSGTTRDIDTSSNAACFADVNGTIFDTTKIAGVIRTRLYPTTAGRTLDVSSGGEAGIDWANVGSPTTTQNLSATSISTSQAVASVSGAVGSVTGAVGSVTGNVGGNVTGSVGSVAGAVGSVTGNVGGNVTGSVGSVASGGITAASIASDALTAAKFHSDVTTELQSGLATSSALSTVSGKIDTIDGIVDSILVDTAEIGAAGIGLTAIPMSQESIDAIVDAMADEPLSGHTTAGTAGKAWSDAQSAGDPWATTLPGSYAEGEAGYIIGTNIDSPVSEAGGGTPPDIATEPVPTSRIFVLVRKSTGLVSEERKTIVKGSPPNTYAIDFRNDAAANQKIYSVDSVAIQSGTAGGVTFGTPERDGGTQARVRITGVTAGDYTVRATITYVGGATERGDILIKVVN